MGFENIFGEDGLSLEKKRIIGLLERDGLSPIVGRDWITPEAQEAVMKWTLEMEKRSLISSIEMVRFNVDRAELYEAYGDIDSMFECLDQALYQVNQEKDAGVEGENWDELLDLLRERINQMEEKYPVSS